MKKLNKVASLFATAALATSMSGAFAQTVDNWVNGSGNLPWKNGTNELCWRDGTWTPATAIAECDGALKPPPPAPVVAPAPPPAPVAAPPAPAPIPVPTTEKVTFAADAFFDFNKSTLKPEGKKNVRRNTSAVMRIDGKDGKKRYVLQRVVLRDRALMAVQDHRYRCRQEFPCGCCRVVSKVWPTTD